ncbi:hypothetical protein ACJMK2_000360 [Sinanodonta woodiana]|uniref:G-protein coupled receptors family 1 profile domain-containing protein n=1 Tax=Sinanodonta woodiana TaxID=1069815 RepID=A0ABD3XPA1_SINWO
MESTEMITSDYVDISHFWNTSENITYDMEWEEYEELLKFISLTRIIIPVLYGLITIFGLLGNILTIAVVLLHKANKGITKYFILNLAIADLLYVIVCVPFQAIYAVLHSSPFGDSWCRIHTYLEYVCFFASMYILVLVSVDRYIALVHPIRALMLRTKRNGYIALIALWSLVILGNIPFIFIAKEVNINPEFIEEQQMVCEIHFKDDTVAPICLFLFSYMLPMILLCGLYGHILKVSLTGKSPSGENNGDHIRLHARKRVTKMVLLVVTVFAVCWMPLQVIMLYTHISKGQHSTVAFASIIYAAQCLAYMNSCINPILYTFYTHTFRNSIKNMICCIKTRFPKHGSYSSVKRGSLSSVKRSRHSCTTSTSFMM